MVLYVSLFLHMSGHCFHVITTKVLQLSTSNRVYSFLMCPKGSLSILGHDLNYQGHHGHKGQIRFLEHNSESSQLESWYRHSVWMGQDRCSFWSHGSFWGQVVNFSVTGGQFWGSLRHGSNRFRATNLKLGTDTWLGSLSAKKSKFPSWVYHAPLCRAIFHKFAP